MKPLLLQGDKSLQHLQITEHPTRYIITGKIILLLEGQPGFIDYQIHCTRQWQTRLVAINQTYNHDSQRLTVMHSPTYGWSANGHQIAFPDDVQDIDLEISPATNTLPIRRLNLEVGQSAAVNAVWVRFPSLKLELLHQRYTRLDTHHYHYEAPALDFTARLEVDDEGVIVDYEGLWRRVTA